MHPILDLQCAWQFLVQCAGPRYYHFLRTVAVELFGSVRRRTAGMQQVM